MEGADERLKDFFFPDIDMQTYLGELAGYCTTVFRLQKEVEETYRQFPLQGAPNYAAMGCGLKMGSKTLVKLGNGLESPGLDSPIGKDMGWKALFWRSCLQPFLVLGLDSTINFGLDSPISFGLGSPISFGLDSPISFWGG